MLAISTVSRGISLYSVLQATTVQELKQLVHAKDVELPPYLQRITFQGPGNGTFAMALNLS